MVNNSTGQSIVCVKTDFHGYREQNLTATEPATETGNFGNISLFYYRLSSCQQELGSVKSNPKLRMPDAQVPRRSHLPAPQSLQRLTSHSRALCQTEPVKNRIYYSKRISLRTDDI